MLIDGFTLFGSWPGLPYDHQVDELISGMERFKLDRACTLSTRGIFFDAATGNETSWTVSQQNAHLIPIGVADPRMGGVEQVDYCRSHGFRMMALFPHSQQWSLTSVTAKAVLQRICEVKLPVMIEAGNDGDSSTILEIMQDLPVPVVLLDVSLQTLTEALAVIQTRPNTYLATRLLCGGDTFELLVKEIGPERLIFTSRFPISCFSSAYLTAKFASISEADRNAIMGDNIARLLKI